MMSVKRAHHETRERDKKRRRYILCVGKKAYHITWKELIRLRNSLNKVWLQEVLSR